ncbi:MAG TPA: tRNA pseudouridine(38-40) synthase TruA [Anaeromyxobacteraceae bacterium]
MRRARYALRLAYDGGAFRGYQRQPGLPSVQACLEQALRPLGLSGRIDVAARTDAGVHALGQVATFWARAEHGPAALRAAVNAGTPPGILCLEAARVPASAHARASALSRRYAYLVGAPPPPPLAPFAWSLPDERAFPGVAAARLDPAAVRASLASAVGTHDFAAFARPGEQRGTVRTLLAAEVVEAEGAPLLALVLEGRGFLRAMVRNLVGTAVAAGLGLAPPSRLGELLAARGRYRGVRAPGWGLTLAGVTYDPPLFPGAAPEAAEGAPEGDR